MGKLKATGNKVHKLRRASVVAFALSLFLAGLGFGMLTQLAGPLLILGEITIGIAALSSVVGIGTLSGYFVEKAKISHYKKISSQNLRKIAEADKNPNIVFSEKQKTAIIKKYANANLKLAKIIGCPFVGRFACVSGLSSDKENEAFNVAENLSIQKSITANHKKSESLGKKYRKKVKLVGKSGSAVSTMHPWTMMYNDFKKQVQIPDRRIEINSLTNTTCEKFKQLAQEMPVTSDIGGCIQVIFGRSKDKQSFIRVADVNYLDAAKDLLIEDILTACEEDPANKQKLFPFTVVKSVFD